MADITPSGERNNLWAAVRDQHRVVSKPEPELRCADGAELRRFIDLVFRNCTSLTGWVALRGFEHEDRTGKPAASAWAPFGADLVDWAAGMATELARLTGDKRAVFAPPVALFGDRRNGWEARSAGNSNVVAGPVIAVELDSRPTEGLERLTAVLGVPTLVVASGGQWEGQDKLHIYYRLAQPAVDAETLGKLTAARRIACDLVGADGTGVAIAHPMRWPGSWHTKGEPRLCRIVGCEETRDVVLDEALAALEAAAKAAGVTVGDGRGAVFRGERYGFKTRQPMSAKTLADAVRLIPNGPYRDEAESWDAWLRVGMAMFDASWASVDGLEAYHAWSAKNAIYDSEATDNRWHRFSSSPPTDISAGKLLFLMREVEPGYVVDREIAETWYEPLDEGVGEADALAPPSDPKAAAVARLNETNAVVQVKGKTLVLVEQRDQRGQITIDYADARARKLWYANDCVLVDNRPVSVFDVWTKSPKRRQYDRVVFEPGSTPASTYNLWKGFGVKPRPDGSCDLFLPHLLDNICRGDRAQFEWLVGWHAQLVQEPGAKPGVAIVLGGGRGVGKSIVGNYVGAMMPQNYVTISHADQLVGKHNSHLQKALLIQVEEAVWAGDKAAEGALKHLITSDVRMVEPKFVDAFPVRDCARLLFTSNEPWIVPAGNDERRYAVFDVGDARRGDKQYFGAIMRELAAGGAGALLAHLQAFDLSTVDVRTAPTTEALGTQKKMTLGSAERWIMERLTDERLDSHTGWPEEIGCTQLFRLYEKETEKARFPRPISPQHFGRIVQDLLKTGAPVRRRNKDAETGRERVYLLPPLGEARRAFEEWFGQPVHWDA